MSLQGKVKWFNPTVRDAGMNGLDEGQALTFDVEDGPKGPSAVNLKTA